MKRIKVGVLYGGKSPEHLVSIESGKAIFSSLSEEKFDKHRIYINEEGEWFLDDRKKGIDEILSYGFDIVFIALHGPNGEDGSIQGLLEIYNVPYTGSDFYASSIAMDKEKTKLILKGLGIKTPKFISFYKNEVDVKRIEKEIGYPCVVKPSRLGSSVGVNIVENKEEIGKFIEEAFKYSERVIVEEYVTDNYKEGKEIECAIIGNKNPISLGIAEILPKRKFYDYTAKYTEGLTEFFIPARLDEETYKRAEEIAVRVYKVVGCKGFARVDMFTRGKEIFVNEVNTIPGFTKVSMFPAIAEKKGISFKELVERIIDLGIEEYREKKRIFKNTIEFIREKKSNKII